MRKRRFEFTAREQGQLLIDKLIADGEIPADMYAVHVGATRNEEGDVLFWAEVASPSAEVLASHSKEGEQG